MTLCIFNYYYRQAALGKWKQHLCSDATYRNLMSAFERAGRKDFADIVYACAIASKFPIINYEVPVAIIILILSLY